jgi:hypothetical protein
MCGTMAGTLTHPAGYLATVKVSRATSESKMKQPGRCDGISEGATQ